VVLSGLIVIALATYWRAPLDSFGGHLGPNEFDLEGITRPPLGPQGIRHSWLIRQSYTMPGSHGNAYNVFRSCITPDGDLDNKCLSHHNIFSSWIYEPASRFWPLQSIEAGIFFVLSAILIVVAVWWIKRRY
jgi:hypothetical protein